MIPMIHFYWILLVLATLPVLPLLWIGWKRKRLWWIGLLPCMALMLYTRLEISAYYRRVHTTPPVSQINENDISLYLPSAAYDNIYEIPFEALFGDNEIFYNWKSTFQQWYTDRIDSIPNLTPSGHTILAQEKFNGLTLNTIEFSYPSYSPLYGKPAGGILAVPDTVLYNIPVIAIHGHEVGYWGQYPIDHFKNKEWSYEIAQNGYIVWLPVSMYHDEIFALGEEFGYPLVWTKIFSEGIDYIVYEKIIEQIINGFSTNEWIAAGLSAGATTGFNLMAYRQDIICGIFAGTEQNLDFLRREYRIIGHANCWDIPGITSYSAVIALIAPRAVQFQSGRGDSFHPHGRALEPQGDWFPGTSRGQLSTEIGGEFLAVRSVYAMFNEDKRFSVFVHDGEHEFRTEEALRFIKDMSR